MGVNPVSTGPRDTARAQGTPMRSWPLGGQGPPAAHWSSDLLRPSAPRPKLTSEAPSAGGALGWALLTAAEVPAAPGLDWTQGGCVCRSQGCSHLQVQGEWRPDRAGGGETPRPRSGHTCTHTHTHMFTCTHTQTQGEWRLDRGGEREIPRDLDTHAHTLT